MTVQQFNAESIELLSANFVKNLAPSTAWGNLGGLLSIPSLRGLWLYGSVDETGAAYDSSGQGRTLTNVSALQYGVYNGLVPYALHDGAADLLRRNDEAGLDITGALTFGCWVRSNDAPVATEGIFSKWNATGNQRSYELIASNTPNFQAVVSSNGLATTSVTSTVTYAADVWFHLVARYTPSTELAIFVNGTKTVNTSTIPASIFNSTANLEIGANNAGAQVLDGDTALPFLSAAALSDTLIQMIFWHQQRALFGRVS